MAIERINTKQGTRLKPGRYTFRVIGVPEKVKMGKFTKRIWKLLPDVDGIEEPVSYHVVPWDAKDLLLAVGGKLDKEGYVEWDDEKVDGKEFIADLTYEEQKGGKLNPSTGKPYTQMVLRNFEQEIAF